MKSHFSFRPLAIILSCLALSVSAFAQSETPAREWQWSDRPHSVTVNLGAQSFWALVDNGSGRTYGSYAVRYDYNVLKWLAVGGKLSYEGKDYSDRNYYYNEVTNSYASSKTDRTCQYASVMMELLFTYINREHVQLYSGAAMGLLYSWDGTKNESKEFQPMLPGWSIIPIGVRAGGNRVYGLAEVSFGTQSLMSIGLGFHF